MDLAALASKASAVCPQGVAGQPIVPGRILLMDGDGLAYNCAGNEDTDTGQARINLNNKISTAKAASGAEHVCILITPSGSPKADRYAVAQVRPYQGQRTGSHRPKNWEFLRQILSKEYYNGHRVVTDNYFEADDVFARASLGCGPSKVVIYTQDKDMRMVPGWHLNWNTYQMFWLHPETWSASFGDKLYGRAWFWSQMLHGDTVDNIPGLPYYMDGSRYKTGIKKGQLKEIRCGDKADVVQTMQDKGSDEDACLYAITLYLSCYQDYYAVAMLEQAILLWIRPRPNVFDVLDNGPLSPLLGHEHFEHARKVIQKRITDYVYAVKTEDDPASGVAV